MTIPEAIDALPLAERTAFRVIQDGVVTDGGLIDPIAKFFQIGLRCLRTITDEEQRDALSTVFDEKLTGIIENGQRVEAFGEDGPYVKTKVPCSGAYLEVHIKRRADLEAQNRAACLDSLAERARQRAGQLPDLDTEGDDAATEPR